MIEDAASRIVKILQRELADESRTYTDRMISVMSRGRHFNDVLVQQGLNAHNMLRILSEEGKPAKERVAE